MLVVLTICAILPVRLSVLFWNYTILIGRVVVRRQQLLKIMSLCPSRVEVSPSQGFTVVDTPNKSEDHIHDVGAIPQ
jgi:hypothetical protein